MKNWTSINVDSAWKEVLAQEIEQDYFIKIRTFLEAESAAGKVIYPPSNLVFNIFDRISLADIRVVILGQDPYHGEGQAHGLSFSVPKTEKIPASLRNVYKELEEDIEGFVKPKHGNLEAWAEQGVFLLNSSLTVEAKKAGAHAKIGWTSFTDAVIKKISDRQEGVVFMLWGAYAKQKSSLVDVSKHLVLEAAHPSPLAGNAFLGNKHFSKANAYLIEQGKQPINWLL